MPDNIVFETEVTHLLETVLTHFAEWVAEHWLTTEAEACTLSEPTENPAAYARGYNDGIRSIPDAMAIWIEDGQYG